MTILFSIMMFSSSSYGEWERLEIKNIQNKYYIDFDKIEKVDGFVYWWDVTDFLKPTPEEYLSVRGYKQGDCKLFKFKNMTFFFHKDAMGKGVGDFYVPPERWNIPPQGTISEIAMKAVCNYAKWGF